MRRVCEGAAFAAETRTENTTQRLTFRGLDAGPGAPEAVEPQTPPLSPQSAPGAPLLADGLQAALRTSRTAAGGERRENHGGRKPQTEQDHPPAREARRRRAAGSGRGAERSKCGGAVPPRLGVGWGRDPRDTQRGFPCACWGSVTRRPQVNGSHVLSLWGPGQSNQRAREGLF